MLTVTPKSMPPFKNEDTEIGAMVEPTAPFYRSALLPASLTGLCPFCPPMRSPGRQDLGARGESSKHKPLQGPQGT